MKRPQGVKRLVHRWQALVRSIIRRNEKDTSKGTPVSFILGPIQIGPPYTMNQPPPIA